jgi:hypothetical protein
VNIWLIQMPFLCLLVKLINKLPQVNKVEVSDTLVPIWVISKYYLGNTRNENRNRGDGRAGFIWRGRRR